ncbi:hypothetical protein [Actinomadura rubrisoli]|uniref:hypothetical protein n=1 Tax=Actinomadura rubrisoli TaxID=2530368 RepID=UPI001FB5DFE8|nr:hypothetical protein [Actinomadura rubrisoli]
MQRGLGRDMGDRTVGADPLDQQTPAMDGQPGIASFWTDSAAHERHGSVMRDRPWPGACAFPAID